MSVIIESTPAKTFAWRVMMCVTMLIGVLLVYMGTRSDHLKWSLPDHCRVMCNTPTNNERICVWTVENMSSECKELYRKNEQAFDRILLISIGLLIFTFWFAFGGKHGSRPLINFNWFCFYAHGLGFFTLGVYSLIVVGWLCSFILLLHSVTDCSSLLPFYVLFVNKSYLINI